MRENEQIEVEVNLMHDRLLFQRHLLSFPPTILPLLLLSLSLFSFQGNSLRHVWFLYCVSVTRRVFKAGLTFRHMSKDTGKISMRKMWLKLIERE
jgi:hypothetical protein